jgi:hypothetical protein
MQILNGFIHCNIVTAGMGMDNNGTSAVYNNQEFHKWYWTNSPPLTIPNSMPTADNLTSVTTSVSGSGVVTRQARKHYFSLLLDDRRIAVGDDVQDLA